MFLKGQWENLKFLALYIHSGLAKKVIEEESIGTFKEVGSGGEGIRNLAEPCVHYVPCPFRGFGALDTETLRAPDITKAETENTPSLKEFWISLQPKPPKP